MCSTIKLIEKILNPRFLSLNLIQNYSRYVSKNDPGIHRRRKMINKHDHEEESDEDNDFDDFESDFMDVDKSHKEHVQEIEKDLERVKHLIVKQKYFKVHLPNFLTMHDKEQIKYLYNSDPEEWSIEKLSEGFPALPDVIKKIVKAKWKAKNENRVKSHDQTVKENWEQFKKGQLDIPMALKEHLNKFTNRGLTLTPFKMNLENDTKQTLKNTREGGEFSEIISSYERLVKKNVEEPKITVNVKTRPRDVKNEEAGTYLAIDKKEFKYKNPITLSDLVQKIEQRKGDNKISDEDQIMLQSLKKGQDLTGGQKDEDNSKSIDLVVRDERPTSVSFGKPKDYAHLVYPEKITIPKKQWKKGFTYKLNDCYYDDDGLFLYRVPGMH